MRLVTTFDEALANIERLQDEVKASPRLADRLGQAHAFYVDDRDENNLRFGFSKFVGYNNLDGETYIKTAANELNGRNTEWVLNAWFTELSPNSELYRTYWKQLAEWLGSFGKKPRRGVRLMVPKPEHRPANSQSEDTRLLDALVAAAELLPLHQRHRLREML